MARIAAKIKQDPQFKALVAALGSEEKAKVAFDRLRPATPEVDPRMQTLLDAGFTEDEAKKALEEEATPAEPAKLAPVTPLSSKERAEALVSDKGFEYTKGRVYGGPSLAEAIVRVHRTGTPQIVTSSGVGRTKAVLVYKEDSGDVALQNLTTA
jgi:hypothetical protein